MKEGYLEIEGWKFHYRIEGEGVPALVIGSALYYSRCFSQNLRNHLQLIFVDWRGFAKKPKESVACSFDQILDDVEIVRKALGLKHFIIIGHSATALLALEYAKKYPEPVSHVVMIGISPNYSVKNGEAAERNWQESVWPERKEAEEERIRKWPDQELAKLPPAERFVRWYIRRDPRAWYDYHFDSSSLWEGVLPNMALFDYLYGVVLKDIDITKGLDRFYQPVFLALGRYDFIVAPPSSWESVRPKFHDLTVRVFERSGHTPQLEEAPLFDAELLKWLS